MFMVTREKQYTLLPGLMFLALLFIASCDCGRSPDLLSEPSPKLEPQRIVNKAYRFAITTPGEGWRLLDETEARGLDSGALVGVMHTAPWTIALVSAIRFPELKIDRYIDDYVVREGAEIDERREERFGDHPAVRLSYRWRDPDGAKTYAYRVLVIKRGDWYFTVMLWGEGSPQLDARLKSVLAHLEFLPGEIVPDEPELNDADGFGLRRWRGNLESALSGIRVEPVDAWQVKIGPEVEVTNPGTVFALQSNKLDVTIHLTPLRTFGSSSLEEELRCLLVDYDIDPSAASSPAFRGTLLGNPVALASRPDAAEGVPELVGLGIRGDWRFEIQAVNLDAERAQEILPEAFALFSTLTPKAHAKLQVSLPEPRLVVRQYGEDFTIQKGVLRQFDADVVWRFSGAWEPLGEGSIDYIDPGADLVFRNRLVDLHGSLRVSTSSESAHAHHTAVGERLGHDSSTMADASVRGVRGYRSKWTWKRCGTDFEGMVWTWIHAGHAIELQVFGRSASFAQSTSALGQLLGGLRFEPGLEPERWLGDEGRFIERRHGFAIRLPGAGWKRSSRIQQTATVVRHRFEVPSQSFVDVVTVELNPAQDHELVRSLVEESGIKELRKLIPRRREMKREDGKLSGVAARKWHTVGAGPHIVVNSLLVEGTLVMVIWTSLKGEAMPDTLFRLLE